MLNLCFHSGESDELGFGEVEWMQLQVGLVSQR